MTLTLWFMPSGTPLLMRRGEGLHRLEARAYRPGEAVREMAGRRPCAHIVPEALEFFLQQVGADDREIEPAEGRDLSSSTTSRIPGAGWCPYAALRPLSDRNTFRRRAPKRTVWIGSDMEGKEC